MKRLQNKVAIITGAANGQGREEAILFAEHGAKVVATDIDESGLKETVRLIEESYGETISFIHDVSLQEDWKKVISKTEEEFGKLDILINNAGIGGKKKSLEETTQELFERVQATNSRGSFLGMKHGAELMKKSGGGSIVNISSIYGLVGSPGSIAYHASKGAVRLMTKSAAVELAKDLIRVNSIHPGLIDTAMSLAVNGKHHLLDRVPLPGLGSPKDIAYGALYLASDESRYVTGTELVIDGGFTAQ